MSAKFNIFPLSKWDRASPRVPKPQPFTHFSYDRSREFHFDDRSRSYYHPPSLPADLKQGFDTCIHHEQVDEHLVALLKAVRLHEAGYESGVRARSKKVDVQAETGRPIENENEHLPQEKRTCVEGSGGSDREAQGKVVTEAGKVQSAVDGDCKKHQQQHQRIKADFLTWRGMMTKILVAPFDSEGFEMNATLFDGTIYIEENFGFRAWRREQEKSRTWNTRYSSDMMSYWGYKFEALSTIPDPVAETPKSYVEERAQHVVNINEQFCPVVQTSIGATTLCMGGEVDCELDPSTFPTSASPGGWIELKTSVEIWNDHGRHPPPPHKLQAFHRKLLKFWAQSFLLGVAHIRVGFRDADGILRRIEALNTLELPHIVQQQSGRDRRPLWDASVCLNFAEAFLAFLKRTISADPGGVWRIRRAPDSQTVEVTKIEPTGHGNVLTEEFVSWRKSGAAWSTSSDNKATSAATLERSTCQ